MDKKIFWVILVLIIIGAVILVVNPFRGGSPTSSQTPPSQSGTNLQSSGSEFGQKLPQFELEDFSGQKVKIATDSGKPILIDFWAAWCPFCLNEMPEIEKIHKELGDKLVVLGIHRSETEGIDTGAKFAKERGVTYTLLKDSTGQVYKTLTGGRQFMPYALFIDKDGKIVKVKAGPKTAEEMRAAVGELLK